MGRQKEEELLREEAMNRQMVRDGLVCYICGAPAPRRDPKEGRLCAYHLNLMQKPD